MALAGCVQSLVDFAIANKQVIIYDSAYAPFIQDPDKPKTIFECEGARQCAIESSSLSKLGGFTGVRLGWTIVPKELEFADGSSVAKDWGRIMGTLFNGAANVAQVRSSHFHRIFMDDLQLSVVRAICGLLLCS